MKHLLSRGMLTALALWSLLLALSSCQPECEDDYCYNGGRLDANCDCTCTGGWGGETCADCNTDASECVNGTYDATACQCVCPPGYGGVYCDIYYGTDNDTLILRFTIDRTVNDSVTDSWVFEWEGDTSTSSIYSEISPGVKQFVTFDPVYDINTRITFRLPLDNIPTYFLYPGQIHKVELELYGGPLIEEFISDSGYFNINMFDDALDKWNIGPGAVDLVEVSNPNSGVGLKVREFLFIQDVD